MLESELLENTCLEKLSKPGVLDIVNENKHKIEPFDDLVNEAAYLLIGEKKSGFNDQIFCN